MARSKMATNFNISEENSEFLNLVASHTGYSREELLEYSVDLLQLLMDWKEILTPDEELDLDSLEDELIDALNLAIKIVNVGGVRRIILVGKGRDRWAVIPEPDSILSPKKKSWWRR